MSSPNINPLASGASTSSVSSAQPTSSAPNVPNVTIPANSSPVEHLSAGIKAIFSPFSTPDIKTLTPLGIGYLNRWQIKHLKPLDLNKSQCLALVQQAAYMTEKQIQDLVYESDEDVIAEALKYLTPEQVSAIKWPHDSTEYIDAIAMGSKNIKIKSICLKYRKDSYHYSHESSLPVRYLLNWTKHASGEQLLRILFNVKSWVDIQAALENLSEKQKEYLVSKADLFSYSAFCSNTFSMPGLTRTNARSSFLVELAKIQPKLLIQISKATTMVAYELYEALFFLSPNEQEEVLDDYVQKASMQELTNLMYDFRREANDSWYQGVGTRGQYAKLFDLAFGLIMKKYPDFTLEKNKEVHDYTDSFFEELIANQLSLSQAGRKSYFWQEIEDILKNLDVNNENDLKMFASFIKACFMKEPDSIFADDEYQKSRYQFIFANRQTILNTLFNVCEKKKCIEMALSTFKKDRYNGCWRLIYEMEKSDRDLIVEAFTAYLFESKDVDRLKNWTKKPIKYSLYDEFLSRLQEDTYNGIRKAVKAKLKAEKKKT